MHAIIKHGTKAFLAVAPARTILTYWFQWYLGRVYYRFWCPGGDVRVKDCIASGKCGCDNDRARMEEMRRLSDDFGAGPIIRYGDDRYGGR